MVVNPLGGSVRLGLITTGPLCHGCALAVCTIDNRKERGLEYIAYVFNTSLCVVFLLLYLL